ncbi:NADH-quinone oxidoreductase subunit L [Tunturiibacter lichenicola]|uniref:NADH-quinone oxidoreductase subunit L n=1 Tax=Tunturiibacter lichenicola TaxID=2051959 RepID=UPI0021B20E38|nr:NADH-quinone oxidoreductase subunit L [Edaphobacter lichenicola]
MPSVSMISDYLWLIPLLPFAGFLINGTIGRKLPRTLITAIALICTAIPAAIVAWLWIVMKADGAPEVIRVVSQPWIAITGLQIDFAFTVDHLTLIMLGVITGVGFLIHLYSVGYMAHEEGYWRFFAYLNLFMFFMSVLVLAESFLLLFVGWEGVGLASYLLIGFYFKKDSAANAGKKAFIVNRIGDFGFLLAMFLLVDRFGSLDFTHVFQAITVNPEWHGGILTAIALLLVLGAVGKSAQIPLYVWLPDAMEGPTPVSALIHAATMVTAGIYMVARCHVLFDRSPYALGIVAIIGAATAIFAACIGMVQQDIKRVLAYSTVSQLGYMFLACGVGAYTAGIFHLLTHAFFKALLFLAAGSVIHSLSGEQDMRKMGGLRKRIPITFWTMTMGVFAISGLPPWAGFFSKDEILYQAFVSTNPLGKLLWFVGLFTAGMTSFYMFRLWFKTFFGPEHFEKHTGLHEHGAAVHSHSGTHAVMLADHEESHGHGIHESPWIMLFPLTVLAILSVIGGWVGISSAMGGHNEIEHFLDPVFSTGAAVEVAAANHGLELGLAAISVLVALTGVGIAYFFYCRKPGTSTALAKGAPALYNLVQNKFYIDEIYSAVIVTPLLMFSRLALGGVVDGGIVNGFGAAAGAITKGFSSLVRRVQSGNIRSYAGWLALGAAAVLLVMIFGRSIWMH